MRIGRDGMKTGLNVEATREIGDAVTGPVIASGGVGGLEHLYEGLEQGHAEPLRAPSIFHQGTHTVGEAKKYLADKGVLIRV